MSENKNKLPSGKLAPSALQRNVLSYCGAPRPEVLIGPGVGEDAAVVEWPAGKYMIVSSDPIVGAEKGAGRLLVRVNANDIASKGGEPAYISVTLILPPSMGEEGAARLMREIDGECRASGVAVIGGHTEFNDLYDRPVISATLIGAADRVMRGSDVAEGDVLVVTKHIGIEGMSILAADRPDLLAPFMDEECIEEIRSWSELTSVLPDSRILRNFASFMHDPTEGGLLGGLDEISSICGLKADIERDAIPLHPLTALAAQKLGFDPLRLIASGSLIAAIPACSVEEAMIALDEAGIPASIIGSFGGKRTEPVPDPREELWRLLKAEKKNV